mmetsp:Transcript_25872/g.49175  ORF Transcript_25872/g.49175 Transcript_25872/m.49175 type:complete len:401 (-) Transcript_25872:346-1548(-)
MKRTTEGDSKPDPLQNLFEGFRFSRNGAAREAAVRSDGKLVSGDGLTTESISNTRNDLQDNGKRRREVPTIEYEDAHESPSTSKQDNAWRAASVPSTRTLEADHHNKPDRIRAGVRSVGISKWFKRGPSPSPQQVHAPDGWEDVFDLVRAQRRNAPASVDEFHEFLLQLRNHREPHFECLVASLLSVQVRDGVALAAMRKLQQMNNSNNHNNTNEVLDHQNVDIKNIKDVNTTTTNNSITAGDIARMPLELLEASISTLNYFRTKAKNIKAIANIILRQFDGKVPDSARELMTLPGVGPKVANLVLSVSFNQDAGIVVDTHVHRFCGRMGWVPTGKSKTAEHTRRLLEKWLPQEHWAEFTLAVIGFSQTVCTPVNPKCNECPLQSTCPSAFKCSPSSDHG